MKRAIILLAVALMLSPTMARAQDPTATPTPTPTSTPTFTPSPTLDVWYEATVGSNQYVQLEYSISAGDGFHAVVLLIGIGLLSLLVFLALVERRR